MSKITYQDKTYERAEGVSVLDTLLEAGLPIPHGCKSGVCQSCLMRAVEGEVPKDAQQGLKETQQEKHYFLACSCYPEGDLTVALPDEADVLTFHSRVLDKAMLNNDVIRLRFAVPADFSYRPGQFVNVIKDEQTQRSYSLASVPALDEFLEIQVKVLENGEVSNWLKNDVYVSDELHFSEAHGDVYFSAEDNQQPILLIGTGTGVAPLYGIVREALRQGHKGELYLYHGGATSEDLYLSEELNSLANEHENFHYVACVSRGEASNTEVSGRANTIALERHKDLKGWKVYLCGNPNMVEATRKQAFLAGANFKDILADAFKFAEK